MIFLERFKYVELCEDRKEVNNNALLIKLFRLLIRYIVRVFGYKYSLVLIKFIYLFVSSYVWMFKGKELYNYVNYLYKINKCNVKLYFYVINNKFFKFNDEKINLIKYIFSNTSNEIIKSDAQKYLNLYDYKYNQNSKDSVTDSISKENHDPKKIYLYGPNTDSPPNEEYFDRTIVLSKPTKHDLSNFKKRILFLNSYTYQVYKTQPLELKKLRAIYEEIYITCLHSEVDNDLNRSLFYTHTPYFGEMSLITQIYNLKKKYQLISIIIEGYDLYTKKKMYSEDYNFFKTNTFKKKYNEATYCRSLMNHDPSYNFLLAKKLLKEMYIHDSYEFKQLLSLSCDDYLSKLFKIRDFSSLK